MEVKILCYMGLVDPAIDEATGLKKGLSWVKSNSWGAVVVETDFYVLVQAIYSSSVQLL